VTTLWTLQLSTLTYNTGSGAGTNLKVRRGTYGPERKCAKRRKFFCRAPPLFGSKSTISRFGEHFRDGQYSLVSFLFAVLLLTVPLVPSPIDSGFHNCTKPSRVAYFVYICTLTSQTLVDIRVHCIVKGLRARSFCYRVTRMLLDRCEM